MKQENKFIKPIFIILLVVAGFMGLSMFLRFNPGALGSMEPIPYSQQVPEDIKKALDITLPDTATYTDGYNITGVNPVSIWIFDLEKVEGEAAEVTIRRSLGLAELCTDGTTVINPEHYDPVAQKLAEKEYPFTHKLFFKNKGSSEIQFREQEDGRIQLAIILKIT